MRPSIHLAALCAGVLLLAPAAAQQSTHAGVSEVDLKNFIGKVTVETTAGGSVSLNRSQGADAGYPVYVEEKGGVLTIRSDEDPDDVDWWDDVDWRRYEENAFDKFLEDYPTITLRIPAGTALDFDSVVTRLTADDTNGRLAIREGHVSGVIGDIAEADISIHGSGDMKIGRIAGAFITGIYGSGDLDAKSAGSLMASIHGSGDVTLGPVAGAAAMSIHGSGDISLADISGPLKLSIHGSGDIETGAVDGGAEIGISGSGNVALASVNGKTAAKIHGSGDIDIDSGRAEDLQVDMRGSGSFGFGGLATNPVVNASHSSDIRIARHEGTVTARGDGEIIISGVDYSDDD